MGRETEKKKAGVHVRPKLTKQVWYTLLSSLVLFIVLNIFNNPVNGLVPVLAVLLTVQILQTVLQPAFSWVAHALGLAGILFISLFSYGVIIWTAFSIVPGVEDVKLGEALAVAWTYALAITLLQWAMLAQSDDYFLQNAIRSAKNKPRAETDTPGFVFVQLDGVSWEVLQWQLHSGNLPNVKRLIDSGDYELRRWQTQIPSTTPASQAGILFGSNAGIPAFRWYERNTRKLVAANQPADASLIESRLSTGHGLLADGGVSIGNIFSGDAPTNIMVISKMEGDRESLRSMREYSDYFSSLYGFMRALILSLGEMVKEVYQARRQRVKNVEPRISRGGSYIALRAATNVLLRDLQTRIVLDKMMKGAKSIYVDYVDYDEIAHHAGIARPEALASLSGLDDVVGILTKAVSYAPRPYRLVFLSDHGQSQGPTFRQLHNGKSLEDFVARLVGSKKVLALTSPIEKQSTPRSLLAETSASSGLRASTLNSIKKKFEKRSKTSSTLRKSDVVVTGSGNLGNIWIKSYVSRPSKKQIEKDYPFFFQKLLRTKGIGLALVANDKQGPLCIGKDGEIDLKTGQVSGTNPLEAYPHTIAAQLYKLASLRNAPDVQVVSDFNPSTGEVYAFEELVGNHGGIGGWQTDAILIHPKDLKIPRKYLQKNEIIDSTNIHRIFIDWLERAGHRKKM